MRVSRVILLAAAGVLLPWTAQADEPHRLPWTYRRFSTAELVASIGFTLGGVALEFATDRVPDNDWRSGGIIDGPVRDAIVARSQEGRARARLWSDILWPAVQYYPVLDSLVTPLASDRFNTDTALQMTLINWETQALAFLITRGTHRLAGRSRPLVLACKDTPSYDGLCDATGARNASFISGHTSMAFAGAGLACAHHLALPMYGSRVADISTCVVLLAGATTTGLMRIVADRHWTSDVLAGAAVGLGTGLLMPWLLHYAHKTAAPAAAAEPTASAPAAARSAVMIGTGGVF